MKEREREMEESTMLNIIMSVYLCLKISWYVRSGGCLLCFLINVDLSSVPFSHSAEQGNMFI